MLREELEEAKRSVTTDNIQISIGEIASMYSQGELDIIPDFQRLFRWGLDKKTAFIESILIGIPVPPAFAFENSDGTWELIDGLQRISTILEFMGILRDPEDRTKVLPASSLSSATYLKSLKGVSWSGGQDGSSALDKSLQLFFRRSRLDFQVLKHPSDPKTKFDLFQRLNRGGEYANEQEVRTCSMVLGNPDATRRIKEIADSEKFIRILKVTDDQKFKQKNVEYLVRAIVHTAEDYNGELDVQEFLDRSILKIIVDRDPEPEIDKVVWAINILDELHQGNALIPHDDAHPGIAQRFSLRGLEAVLVGIARNSRSIANLDNPKEFVRSRLDEFWRQEAVAELSASGLRGTTRLQRTVPFGDNWFKPNE
ncbi:DUF262 domain-containing protein [Microbulbifer thermotolerans]|uniref:DUF262 domain-containing protein n=1 Tax=Microbulbifer thermotolerans TaxID=252514 RepID=UPI002671E88C|nr:DUF262 domain-containing protein [Microbulbifer thermotolerans]WKT60037.1 DUF262 domain-containing protein [Microbulbifer thermotolerans]